MLFCDEVVLTNNSCINRSSTNQGFHKGLVQVLTGHGKGKTTSAIGSIVRALSHGLKVYVAVFMKTSSTGGEWVFLSKLPGVKIEFFGSDNFCDPAHIKPMEQEHSRLALSSARKAMHSGEYNLIVLDEVNVAAAWKLIDNEDVIKLIEEKPQEIELILTGRYADFEVVKIADMVTEMLSIKHPFDTGEAAREGIEY
jgi:cob(I)alamin adenosyltransferase